MFVARDVSTRSLPTTKSAKKSSLAYVAHAALQTKWTVLTRLANSLYSTSVKSYNLILILQFFLIIPRISQQIESRNQSSKCPWTILKCLTRTRDSKNLFLKRRLTWALAAHRTSYANYIKCNSSSVCLVITSSISHCVVFSAPIATLWHIGMPLNPCSLSWSHRKMTVKAACTFSKQFASFSPKFSLLCRSLLARFS